MSFLDACSMPNVEALKRIVTTSYPNGEWISCCGSDKGTGLHLAAFYGRNENIEYLLSVLDNLDVAAYDRFKKAKKEGKVAAPQPDPSPSQPIQQSSKRKKKLNQPITPPVNKDKLVPPVSLKEKALLKGDSAGRTPLHHATYPPTIELIVNKCSWAYVYADDDDECSTSATAATPKSPYPRKTLYVMSARTHTGQDVLCHCMSESSFTAAKTLVRLGAPVNHETQFIRESVNPTQTSFYNAMGYNQVTKENSTLNLPPTPLQYLIQNIANQQRHGSDWDNRRVKEDWVRLILDAGGDPTDVKRAAVKPQWKSAFEHDWAMMQ